MPDDPRKRFKAALKTETTISDNGDHAAAAVESLEPRSVLFRGHELDEEMNDVDEEVPRSSQAEAVAAAAAETADIDEPLPAPDLNAVDSEAAPTVTATPVSYSAASILISRIIQPSPYPQHNAGPSASRFRNILHRVTSSPDRDIEAWQALLTEAKTCYRSIPSVHAVDAETSAQLDWIESCYGYALRFFPYAANYHTEIVEILLRQAARVGEEGGPASDYGRSTPSRRAISCDNKAVALLSHLLGFNLQGQRIPTAVDGFNATVAASGLCANSVSERSWWMPHAKPNGCSSRYLQSSVRRPPMLMN
jgi:hypothetical protein